MLTIQQLSQELNLGVDTLRIWERRYGFPKPARDSRGHRRYPLEQVDLLRTVCRLQELGHRPNKIFALSEKERTDILEQAQQITNPELINYEALILNGSVSKIENKLRSYLSVNGLEQLITERILPIIRIMGRHWINGKLSIAREHMISDILGDILKEQLLLPHPQEPDRTIIFLTLCGERHKLGLLMSAALFHLLGINCLLIQEELPLMEVPQLALDTSSDAVALSFSSHYSSRQAKKDLATLRNELDPEIKIIAGGNAIQKPFHLPDVILCSDLGQIPEIYRKFFSGSKSSVKAAAAG
ncbi:MAG: MerR family transcriptional regulator [Desulfuromonadales bacterium]|nr:MerR family transcriptional regulator [Desulfuromonadales bacterium]MBN2792507.1 MerR family transcriptional regulator [Desulfuromonadales bacterium]